MADSSTSITSSTVADDTTSTTVPDDTTSTTVADDTTSTTVPDGEDDDKSRLELGAGTYSFNLPNGGSVAVTLDENLFIVSFDISSPDDWSWEIEKHEHDRLRIEFENDSQEIEIDIRVRPDHLEVDIDS